MLAEWLESFWNTCPYYLRDMGCVREMLGVRRRWRRFRQAWEPHCQRAKELILSAMNRCSRHRHALILGSGWLHDVPLHELAQRFHKVTLVDLYHPRQVRSQTRSLPNIDFIPADVTGVLEEVWRLGFEPTPDLPISRPNLFRDDPDLDLTVSLNLLSQLPCLPERYLLAGRAIAPENVRTFCRQLVEAHLDYLHSLPGVVTLLTDTELRTFNRHGKEIARKSTIYGLELSLEGQRWDWVLAPRLESWPHHREVLSVTGIVDLKAAKRAPHS
ncbi:MAG: hypothetical protein ACKO23_05910 [Gemmataceae bacterium]